MPSVTYMNQSAPFWDFIASLEQQRENHATAAQNGSHEAERPEGHGHDHDHDAPPFGPGSWGGKLFGGRDFPHRGPPPHHRRHHDNESEACGAGNNEKDAEITGKDQDKANNGGGPAGRSESEECCAGGRGRHDRCGGGARSWSHHGPHGGPRRAPSFRRRGGWGSWGRGGFFGGGVDPSVLAEHFWNQFNADNEAHNKAATDHEDHTPDADIFDTEHAFVVHVSLPGAKKEDVGVNWDAEKSELSVAGVTYRPGDEEFLKTLAMNERKVGPFSRKIRLGTRATPAHIDVDAITAKLEDGILRIEVPKLDTGYVEIKKVDIE